MPVPLHSGVISNNSILKASWTLGYCQGDSGVLTPCATRLSDGSNGLVRIETNSSASIFLIQLRSPFSNLLSHSSLSYHLRMMTPYNSSNLRVRFSEVANGTYYSADVATLDGQGNSMAVGGIDITTMRNTLGSIQDLPVRLQIDSNPSTSTLLMDFEVNAQDAIAFGLLVYSNSLAMSAILILSGVYYRSRLFHVSKRFRWISRVLLLLAVCAISVPIASAVFQVWPPLDQAFIWTFVFGVALSVVFLGFFVAYRREFI